MKKKQYDYLEEEAIALFGEKFQIPSYIVVDAITMETLVQRMNVAVCNGFKKASEIVTAMEPGITSYSKDTRYSVIMEYDATLASKGSEIKCALLVWLEKHNLDSNGRYTN
jgi:hypothetical protein